MFYKTSDRNCLRVDLTVDLVFFVDNNSHIKLFLTINKCEVSYNGTLKIIKGTHIKAIQTPNC